MTRCPIAVQFGITLKTRCDKEAGHIEHNHEGPGLKEFSFQRIDWFDGDRRIFETDIDLPHAWED